MFAVVVCEVVGHQWNLQDEDDLVDCLLVIVMQQVEYRIWWMLVLAD